MSVKKGPSQKEKRKTNARLPSARAKKSAGNEPRLNHSNGQLPEENGIKELVLMGDEVGDPDISMLVQQ
jgi:hypothetical protein